MGGWRDRPCGGNSVCNIFAVVHMQQQLPLNMQGQDVTPMCHTSPCVLSEICKCDWNCSPDLQVSRHCVWRHRHQVRKDWQHVVQSVGPKKLETGQSYLRTVHVILSTSTEQSHQLKQSCIWLCWVIVTTHHFPENHLAFVQKLIHLSICKWTQERVLSAETVIDRHASHHLVWLMVGTTLLNYQCLLLCDEWYLRSDFVTVFGIGNHYVCTHMESLFNMFARVNADEFDRNWVAI